MLAPAILILFQFAATLPQTSGEWCKPVITNVTGKVTVNCTGIDPRALDVLNAELARTNVELNEKVRRANLWAERYKQVEKRLEEAGVTSELARTAQDYLRRGALKEAGEVLDRIIAQEGKALPRLASDHFSRALVYELQFRPTDAITHLERAHRFAPQDWRYASEYALLLAEQHRTSEQYALFADMKPFLGPSYKHAAEDVPYVAQVLVSFAQYCSVTGHDEEAAQSYELAFKGLLPLVTIDPSRYFVLWIQIATNLGTLYMHEGKVDEANGKFAEALTLEEMIAKGDPDSMAPFIAQTYASIGDAYRARRKGNEALDAYNKAVETLNKVLAKDPERYKPASAELILKIAHLHAGSGNGQLAAALLDADVYVIRQLVERNAALYGPELADALDTLATVEAGQEKFGEAEKASEESIGLWRKAVGVSPETALPSLNDALLHEAQFFVLSGQMERAQKAADEALSTARQIEVIKLPASLDAKAATLSVLAGVAAGKKSWQTAQELDGQAIDIYKGLAKNDPSYLPREAEVLKDRGEAFANDHKTAQAEASYLEMLRIIRQMAASDPDSYEVTVGGALIEVATFYGDSGNLDDAVRYARESVEVFRKLRRSGEQWAADLAKSLLFEAVLLSKGDADCKAISPLVEEARKEAEKDAADYLQKLIASGAIPDCR
jgi:hypothetical protein